MQPTSKQLAYIKRLAISRNISFTPPTTKTQASQLISQLKQRRPSTSTERAIDRQGLQNARVAATAASAVRGDEITGYGSHARWA